MCSGQCEKCPMKCGALTLEKLANNTKQGKEQSGMCMSGEAVKLSGCGSPKEPEEIRQNAAILNLTEKVKIICKLSITGIILTVAVSVFLSGKIIDLQKSNIESKFKIEQLEKQLLKQKNSY